ncbi:MAG: polyprenyl synthetase family protein [Hyphomicrobium sp.]|nr:polyprenyl synthetase family protein [Hyphomicrobium sp.]
MDAAARIERALETALSRAEGHAGGPAGSSRSAPPGLANAIRYAVFPGGARVRPRLCLAVADACAIDSPIIADNAAAAIELMHCASLVHDDLPCFDDADQRRGKSSVHKVYGEPLAVLTGDAMIVMAFETMCAGATASPSRLPGLVTALSRAVGGPSGIISGQAWECEPEIDLVQYHRAKTGALFAAATSMGALAAGESPDRWRPLGELIGEAYQVADDIQDMISDAATIGKPCGQDAAHARPSAPRALGLEGAVARIESLLRDAVDAIPPCEGAAELRSIIAAQAKRFVPKSLGRHAA